MEVCLCTSENVFQEDEILDLNVSFNEFEDEVPTIPPNDNVKMNERLSEENSTNRSVEADDDVHDSGEENRFVQDINGNSKASENWRDGSMQISKDRVVTHDLREKLNDRQHAKRRSLSPTGTCCDNVSVTASEENLRQFKKPRLEHMEVDEELESTPQELNKKRGGVKKKKKKKTCNYERRHIVPRIGNLFKPLNVGVDDSPDKVASEIRYRLNEEKTRLIKRCVNCIGCEKAIDLFNETKLVQRRGGMKTVDGNRRRTNGGVFLSLLKSRGYATKEQIKEIFAEEKAAAKEKEKRMKQISEIKENNCRHQNEGKELVNVEEADMLSCSEETI